MPVVVVVMLGSLISIPSKAMHEWVTSRKHAPPNPSEHGGDQVTRAAKARQEWIIIWTNPFIMVMMIVTHVLPSPDHTKMTDTH